MRNYLLIVILSTAYGLSLAGCDAPRKPPMAPSVDMEVTPPLSPEGDDDEDGYSNGIELRYGGDPRNPEVIPPDADGDLIVDALDDDMDNDGFSNQVERRYDTDPRDPESKPSDLDGDGLPDPEDNDRDGDDVDNSSDDFPDDSSENRDTDRDGVGDNADDDDDGDGFSDEVELRLASDPLDSRSTPEDLDEDGVPDADDPDIDGDGTNNEGDTFPRDPSEQTDTDSDGVGNNADSDDDGDGYSDEIELQLNTDPLDPSSVPDDLDEDRIPDQLDSDIDGDQIDNDRDAFPRDPNEYQDTDGDGIGDNADDDDDEDGYPDSVERGAGTDPLDPSSKPSDLDGDGLADIIDPDLDGDGVDNAEDVFPYDPDEQSDLDRDGSGDNADADDDGDRYADEVELRLGSDPLNAASTPPDQDHDFIADADDEDRDGDGVDNREDAFPDDPSETRDTDGDGEGDQSDLDDDGDGYSDLDELAAHTDPLDPVSRPQDLDGDGIVDQDDDDIDGDGFSNDDDIAPRDPSEWSDLDGDGIGDNADDDDDGDGYLDAIEVVAGTDPADAGSYPTDLDGDLIPDDEDDDIDGDTYANDVDRFPRDRSEWLDSDDDSLGNNADLDDDNDQFLDADELAVGTDPLDPQSTPPDLDGDFIPDALDDDRDGDQVENAQDHFPDDPSEWRDFDQDLIGDNADIDDDNDQYPDELEIQFGSNPLDASSLPPDIDSDLIPDPIDPDIDGDGYLNHRDAFPNDPTRWEETIEEDSFAETYQDLIPPDANIDELDSKRFSLVRGSVIDPEAQPIEGIEVSIFGHPEFGTTRTDADGEWILPLNGGGTYTFRFYDPLGSPTIDRNIHVPNQDIAVLPAVEITPLDPEVTIDTLDGDANSAVVHQNQGFEAPLTVVIPKDVVAYGTRADGSKELLTDVNVRVTEYETPEGMPASLPPSSLFTLCFEFKVDGYEHVEFSKPVTVWVPNFLGFNVGDAVPFGYYNRDIATWVPLPDGVIVTLLDGDGDGFVDSVDATGDGFPNDLDGDGEFSDEVFGIDDSPGFVEGVEYWRLLTDHFSPLDPNYPTGQCPECGPPPGDGDNGDGPQGPDNPNEGDSGCGNSGSSHVDIMNRTLKQHISLLGTPLSLHYNSEWTDGHLIPIDFMLSSDNVNASLKGIKARYGIAGRVVEEERPPLPNQFGQILWDGRDFLGKEVTGKAMAWAEVSFVYRPYYYTNRAEALEAVSSFAGRGTQVSGAFTRGDVTLSRRWEFPVYRYDTWGQGTTTRLGDGWGLGGYYTYDHTTRTVIDGAGNRLRAADVGKIIDTAHEEALDVDPTSAAVDARGDLFFIGSDFDIPTSKIYQLGERRCGCPEDLGGQRCTQSDPAPICDTLGCVSTENLLFWLDASALELESGDRVETWLSSADAPHHASQLSPELQPIYVEDGLMGRPSLRFDGVDDRLDFTENQLFDGPSTLIVVATSSSSSGHIAGAQNGLVGNGTSIAGSELNVRTQGEATLVSLPSYSGFPWIITTTRQADYGVGELLGRWEFGDQDNPTADLTGNYVGTFINSAIVAQDEERGPVLQFPNENSRLEISPLDLRSQWTISTWFKTIKPNSRWRTLTRGTNYHSVIIENGGFRLGMYDQRGFRSSGYRVDQLENPDAWHHLIAVGENGTTTFYIDGQHVGVSDGQVTDDIIAIGNIQGGGQAFADYLDDFRVYDIALSPTQAANLYQGLPLSHRTSTYVNGHHRSTALTDFSVEAPLKLTLGAADGLDTGESANPFAGDLAEVIAFDRVLAPEERSQIEESLAARYKIVSFWDEKCIEGTESIDQSNELSVLYDHGEQIDDLAADPRGGLVFSSGPLIFRLKPGEVEAQAIANLSFEYFECFATQGDYCRVEVAVDPNGYIHAVSRYQGSFSSGNHLSLISPDGTVVRFPLNFSCIVTDLAVSPDGSSYLSCAAGPVRRLDPNGAVTLLRGWDQNCDARSSYSGGSGIAVSQKGEVYLADRRCNRVTKIDPSFGANIYAGNGQTGYEGDGGALLDARLDGPTGVALSPTGKLYIADTRNAAIREIKAQKLGIIEVPNGEIYIPKGDGTVLVFSDTHVLKAVRDILTGIEIVTYHYDDELRLESVSYGDRTTSLIYAEADPSQISQIVGPYGGTTDLIYDEAGRLSQIQREDQSAFTFGYNFRDLMLWKETPEGHRSHYTYTEEGRLRTTEKGGKLTTYLRGRAQGAQAQSVTMVTPDGQRELIDQRKLDGSRVASVIDAQGELTQTEIASDGQSRIITEPNGMVTVIEMGVDPVSSLPYPARVTQTLPSGKGRLLEEYRSYDPETGLNVIENYRDGHLVERKVTDPTSREVSMALNGQSEHLFTLDPETNQPVEYTAPGRASAKYHYDQEGLLTEIEQGALSITYDYNDRAQISTVSIGDQLIHRLEYDDLGRMTSSIRANGRTERFEYTAGSSHLPKGNISKYTSPTGLEINHEFGSFGEIKSIRRDGVELIAQTHDLGGRVTRITQADGQVRDFTYRDGYLSRIQSSGAGRATTFEMSAGRLTRTVSAYGVSQEFSYDGPNLLSERWSGHDLLSLSWSYDQTLRINAFTYGGVTSPIRYDASGRVISEGDLTFGFDVETQLRNSVSDDNGTLSWEKDELGRMISQRIEVNGERYDLNLTFDGSSQITDSVYTNADQSTRGRYFTLDELFQVTEVSDDESVIEQYTYDQAGRRTSAIHPEMGWDGEQWTWSHDQLLSSPDATFTYTLMGERDTKTTDEGVTYYHYVDGALSQVDLPSGDIITYRYGYGGLLAERSLNGSVTHRYVYDQSLQLRLVANASDQIIERYDWLNQRPIRVVHSGQSFWLNVDQVGTIHQLIGSDGQIAQSYDFDSFGNLLSSTQGAPTTSLSFGSGIRDPDTGLIIMGLRHYDPQVGLFLQVDPLSFLVSDQGYQYAENAPQQQSDRIGMAGIPSLGNTVEGFILRTVLKANLIPRWSGYGNLTDAAASNAGNVAGSVGNLQSNPWVSVASESAGALVSKVTSGAFGGTSYLGVGSALFDATTQNIRSEYQGTWQGETLEAANIGLKGAAAAASLAVAVQGLTSAFAVAAPLAAFGPVGWVAGAGVVALGLAGVGLAAFGMHNYLQNDLPQYLAPRWSNITSALSCALSLYGQNASLGLVMP